MSVALLPKFYVSLSLPRRSRHVLLFKKMSLFLPEGCCGGYTAAQAKLVRCIHGVVIDVAVDLRLQSPTFGRHVAVRLSGTTKQQLYIPRGFAHGYLVVSDEAIFSYKVDNGYSPQDECHLYPFDPEIGVDWLQHGVSREQLILSPKDLAGSSLQQYLRG